jgi:hypothetical protein
MSSSNSERVQPQPLGPDPLKQKVLDIALGESLKWTAVTGVLATAGVMHASKHNPWFKKSTNMSVRGIQYIYR